MRFSLLCLLFIACREEPLAGVNETPWTRCIDDGIRFCYSGPGTTAARGACHPGTESCSNGVITCRNEQVPEPEICDGKDNDCDGDVDEGLTRNVDIVLVIDESCSMQPYLSKINSSVASWSAQNPSLRFALVGAPGYVEDGTLEVLRDFTDVANLSAALARQSVHPYSSEPTLDALYYVLKSGPGLSWQPGVQRAVIMFTDEAAQSFADPPLTPGRVGFELTDTVDIHIFTRVGDQDTHDSFAGLGILHNIEDPYPDFQAALRGTLLAIGCRK